MIRKTKTENGTLQFRHTADPRITTFIEGYADGIIRVLIGATPAPASIIGIEPAAKSSDESCEDSDCFNLKTGNLCLKLNKTDGSFLWTDSSGAILLSQPFPELNEQKVIKYIKGEGEAKKVKTADGERNIVTDLIPIEDKTAYRAKLFFNFNDDENIHGLGQAEEGIYNYNGKTQYLYQHNMRTPFPFILSNKHWAILIDCGCLMTFNGAETHPYLFLDTIDALDFYFIHGDTVDNIITKLRNLTGRAPLLPKWAFGYIQSKEAYHTQNELTEIASEYRRRHIPLDCIVQDWNTWETGKWGNKRVDKNRYPDIAAANKELHSMNVHSIVSIWPVVSGEDKDEFAAAGHLLLNNSTYNAFNEDARKLYWKQADRELFSGGFDGWWCDSSEPFIDADWSGKFLREPWERYLLVGADHKKYLDPAKANCYALEHAKGIYQNQRLQCSDKRVINLTRSGWAGSQKYAAVLWSGDICARWDVLRKQITEGLNLCMSGHPWWNLDIGGFFVVRDNWQARGCGMNTSPDPLWFWQGDFEEGLKDLGYRELYLRWLQFGCFLPVFRSHGTDCPREIWRFGEKGDVFYDGIEAFIRLRYRLMPYIYSLAGMVHFDHYTMMRSLLFDFSDDKKARNISSEYMFGQAFLVCPITEPMRYGPGNKTLNKKEEWQCYLPGTQDTIWYDFWTGVKYNGGKDIVVSAPLDKMPLFVRAGSIIPMETSLIEYAEQPGTGDFEICIYPGRDGEFVLYEDAGDGYEYEEGKYNRIRLKWNDKDKVFTIGAAEHEFNQSIKNRTCVLCIGDTRKTIAYSGKEESYLWKD